MGKGILIVILGGIVILNYMNMNNNNRVTKATKVAESAFSKSKARNICNSTIEKLLAELGDDGNYRDSITAPISWFDGNITYRVKDTTIGDEDLVKIQVTSEYFGSTANATVIAWIPNSGYIPLPIKGIISTNNDINALGTLVIDGRNHDKNGNLITNSGIYGIWTTGTFSQGGSVTVGGTDQTTNIDYSPTNPADSKIIKTNQTWAGGYPSSPDELLGGEQEGFPEGKLKSLAQSGISGSQYVTDPSTLTFPLQGITFIEGSYGTSGSASIEGEGILIVHNSALDAILKNATDTFKGLIIADDIDKFKGNLIGALVGLTPAPASGNCIGNGSGTILFSEEALKISTQNVDKLNSGFGKHRVTVISWLE